MFGGENQKAARKNVPKKRARTHRAHRHAVKTMLRTEGQDADPGTVRRKPFHTWPGATRAVHLERQERRRDEQRAAPRRSEEARRRRSFRRRLGC
jgi:hypothetical protein